MYYLEWWATAVAILAHSVILQKMLIIRKANNALFFKLTKILWDFLESRTEKKDAKNFGNVKRPPIICKDQDNTPVTCLLPPPEYWTVRKLYNELEAISFQNVAWLKALKVKKEDYHGRDFVSNDSWKFLENFDCLETFDPPSSCGKFVSVLKSFNEVLSSYYGTELHPEFQCNVAIFGNGYFKLSITVESKVDAVMFHVAEFCLLTGGELGHYR